MPDITPGQVSLDQAMVLPPEEDLGSVQAIITRSWNAYMVQVVLKQNGESRKLVGKEVTRLNSRRRHEGLREDKSAKDVRPERPRPAKRS